MAAFAKQASVLCAAVQLATLLCATPPLRAAGALTCDAEKLVLTSDEALQMVKGCSVLQNLEIRGSGVTSLTDLQSLEIAAEIRIVEATTLMSLSGLENLTGVGGFIVDGSSNLTSLEGLQSLRSARSVEVTSNSGLETLAGLGSLTKVGTITIDSNSKLLALGFESLQSAERMSVSRNAALQSLAGLERLTSLDGELSIWDNQALGSLGGLESLSSAGSLSIGFCSALQSLRGLESLTSVADDFDISNGGALESLEGLESLERVGRLSIRYNGALKLLWGLERLTSAAAGIEISYNPALESLDGLKNLESVGRLSIGNNGALKSLQGLDSLASVTVDARISGNDALESLWGLERLTSAAAGIEISYNPALESLDGLKNLGSVGRLSIGNNGALKSLQGLDSLANVTEDARISGNDALESLWGLERLAAAGLLEISNNRALKSLQGLDGLANVADNFEISSSGALESLDGLKSLTSVGLFSIGYNGALKSLRGLESFTSAVEGVQISYNNALESLEGLEKLASVGHLRIGYNGALKSLRGLDGLASAVEDIEISFNHALESLDGLKSLASVGHLRIGYNFALKSLRGLESLTSVVERVQISQNGALESLTGLESLRAVGSLEIQGNGALKSLPGLESLASVAQTIQVSHNDALESLLGLESLTAVGRLEIWYNNGLKSLHGLKNLTTVEGLSIWYNGLESLGGLESLTTIGGSLEIVVNNALESLGGLERLTAIGRLDIRWNAALKSLQGLANLMTVAGLFWIESNAALESLRGPEKLTAIAGSFDIEYNAALESLWGLASLTTVGGGLKIQSNAALRSLQGPESLTTVASFVHIWYNSPLESLEGLEKLTDAEGVVIYENAALESLQGLKALKSVGYLDVQWSGVKSLEGLESLTTVEEDLMISHNNALESLEGLENLTSVGMLALTGNAKVKSLSGIEQVVWTKLNLHRTFLESLHGLSSPREAVSVVLDSNEKLVSLSGLEGLKTVGRLTVQKNAKLTSLCGLGLVNVQGAAEVSENTGITSLEGLENLQRVAELRIDGIPQVRSLYPGLQSLEQVFRTIVIRPCILLSLHGLGALREAGEVTLVFGGSQDGCHFSPEPMHVMGGPFAKDAWIDRIDIDDRAWPLCWTRHERLALASATVAEAAIPKERCIGRSLIDLVLCMKGQPCSFSVASFSIGANENDTLGSVFVSGLRTGCGSCPENHLQSRITSDRMVRFGGDAFRDEEVGLRSICLCGDSGEIGPVGELSLQGPRVSSRIITCIRGHNCTVEFGGETLESTDQVALMRGGACNQGDPDLGFEAKWTSGNTSNSEYLLGGLTGWYAAPAIRYQVCWRTPCSADKTECPVNAYVNIGQVVLRGPFPAGERTVILGENLTVAIIGYNLVDGDKMRLLRSCGQPNKDGMEALEAISSRGGFHFGLLAKERVQAGEYHLCWCQELNDPVNGVKCEDDHDFMAESGKVHILCPAGQELVVESGPCSQCPAGRERLEPRDPEPCSACPMGNFSEEGEKCQPCTGGTVARVVGSSTCVRCRGWESANSDATACTPSAPMFVLLTSFSLSVGALCALLAHTIKRRLSVLDVSLDEHRTIVTTVGPHGLYNFGRASFPVTFHDTGHPNLDSPSKTLRVRVVDTARLELITQQGGSVDDRIDTSMGTLALSFRQELSHKGWPVPLLFGVPALLIMVVALCAPLLIVELAAEASLAAAVGALVCTAPVVARRAHPHATPLVRSLREFERKLAKENGIRRCEKGALRALGVGRLQQLLEAFHGYIRDRDAHFLISNIIMPLTRAENVSYAELVGPKQVEWFVSHFWGTAYGQFFMALRKHAESVCDNGDWSQVPYWVYFCSNNQHKVEDDFAAGWQESAFHLTLASKHCKGTCMVLDDQALPLTRIWCIFELLQTAVQKLENDTFEGLFFCTTGGVLNTGSGSVDVAMALSRKVADMDLATAQATSEIEAQRIRAEVIRQMGSFTALKRFVCREVHNTLAHAHTNANKRFVAVLRLLQERILELMAPDGNLLSL